MAMQLHAALETPFSLESVTPTSAPAGGNGMWHTYIIVQGDNRIVGSRAGTLAEVSIQARDMIDRLNERSGKQLAKLKK
jgi:hypothetical protein